MEQAILRYDHITRAVHWLLAVLIFAEYILGLTLKISGWKYLHIQVGCIILLLVLFRIYWRLGHEVPPLDVRISKLNLLLAKIGHLVLYGLMLVLPLSGLILVFSKGVPLVLLGVPIEPLVSAATHATRHQIKELHEFFAHSIIILATIHLIIALKHQYIGKLAMLQRMLPKAWDRFFTLRINEHKKD